MGHRRRKGDPRSGPGKAPSPRDQLGADAHELELPNRGQRFEAETAGPFQVLRIGDHARQAPDEDAPARGRRRTCRPTTRDVAKAKALLDDIGVKDANGDGVRHLPTGEAFAPELLITAA